MTFKKLSVMSYEKSWPQSGQRMSSLEVRKPRPTRDTLQRLQLKHSLCHWRCSNEMYLLPPRPEEKEHQGGEGRVSLLLGLKPEQVKEVMWCWSKHVHMTGY